MRKPPRMGHHADGARHRVGARPLVQRRRHHGDDVAEAGRGVPRRRSGWSAARGERGASPAIHEQRRSRRRRRSSTRPCCSRRPGSRGRRARDGRVGRQEAGLARPPLVAIIRFWFSSAAQLKKSPSSVAARIRDGVDRDDVREHQLFARRRGTRRSRPARRPQKGRASARPCSAGPRRRMA